MGPTWGPPGSCRPQMAPVLAPWTLLSRKTKHNKAQCGASMGFYQLVVCGQAVIYSARINSNSDWSEVTIYFSVVVHRISLCWRRSAMDGPDQEYGSRFTNVNVLDSDYIPWHNKVVGGVYWFHSVRPSVGPSVRPTSCVRSVAPTVLVGSISYLYLLSCNFRRCVACKFSCKISKFEFLAIFLNL